MGLAHTVLAQYRARPRRTGRAALEDSLVSSWMRILPTPEREQVFGGNVVRVLGLKINGPGAEAQSR
jgi:hypothetical protein